MGKRLCVFYWNKSTLCDNESLPCTQIHLTIYYLHHGQVTSPSQSTLTPFTLAFTPWSNFPVSRRPRHPCFSWAVGGDQNTWRKQAWQIITVAVKSRCWTQIEMQYFHWPAHKCISFWNSDMAKCWQQNCQHSVPYFWQYSKQRSPCAPLCCSPSVCLVLTSPLSSFKCVTDSSKHQSGLQ